MIEEFKWALMDAGAVVTARLKNPGMTLDEFLDQVLKLKNYSGGLYIHCDDEFYVITYENGLVTWKSREELDRIGAFRVIALEDPNGQ